MNGAQNVAHRARKLAFSDSLLEIHVLKPFLEFWYPKFWGWGPAI